MTINNTTEIDEWTFEVIIKQLREYRGGDAGELSPEAIAGIIAFLNLEEDDREAVLQALPAFVCMECGKPSCLHGYSGE